MENKTSPKPLTFFESVSNTDDGRGNTTVSELVIKIL